MFFKPFTKCSSQFFYILITAIQLMAPVPINNFHFSVPMKTSFLGDTRMFLGILLPLKYVWVPYLPQMFLKLSPRPCMYGMTMYPLDLFLMILPLFSCLQLQLLLVLCWIFFNSILSNAHRGELAISKGLPLKCSFSVLCISGGANCFSTMA